MTPAPNDLIVIDGRFWKIESVIYGAVGCESVVGVIPINKLAPSDVDGKRATGSLYVPSLFIDSLIESGWAHLYREVKHVES